MDKRRARLRAIFAKLKNKSKAVNDKSKAIESHPIATGFAASAVGGIALGLGALKIGRPLIAKTGNVQDLAKIAKGARRLYPSLKKVPIKRSYLAGLKGGGAYDPGGLGLSRKPTVLIRTKKELQTHPDVLAHEIGHARFHQVVRKPGRVVLRAGKINDVTGILPVASVGAQPIISRANVSEEKKRKLRIASIGLGVAGTVPTLADEAAATIIGSKIAKASSMSAKQVLRTNARGFTTYSAQAASHSIFPTVAGLGYLQRDKKKKKMRRA